MTTPSISGAWKERSTKRRHNGPSGSANIRALSTRIMPSPGNRILMSKEGAVPVPAAPSSMIPSLELGFRSAAPPPLKPCTSGTRAAGYSAVVQLVDGFASTITKPVHDRILLGQRLSNEHCGVNHAIGQDICAGVGQAREPLQGIGPDVAR